MLQAAKYIGSGLATIGLTKQVLSPVLSNRLLCSSVVSPTAIQAIQTVDQMIESLPENSPVFQHLEAVASTSETMLEVTAKVQGDLVIPFGLYKILRSVNKSYT